MTFILRVSCDACCDDPDGCSFDDEVYDTREEAETAGEDKCNGPPWSYVVIERERGK